LPFQEGDLIAVINTAGTFLVPPTIIVKGKHEEGQDGQEKNVGKPRAIRRPGWWGTLAARLRSTTSQNAALSTQENAWMTLDIFFKWLKDVFLPAT
jgi:hypothetical protein